MAGNFDVHKMYIRLSGFCQAMNWFDASVALNYAWTKHEGQLRKGGQPYIIHPLTLAAHATALGVREERVISTLLLHDVCEDCNVRFDELPVDVETKEAVMCLTHRKGVPLDVYYREIEENRIASISKVFDRCDNVSTMAGVFS